VPAEQTPLPLAVAALAPEEALGCGRGGGAFLSAADSVRTDRLVGIPAPATGVALAAQLPAAPDGHRPGPGVLGAELGPLTTYSVVFCSVHKRMMQFRPPQVHHSSLGVLSTELHLPPAAVQTA